MTFLAVWACMALLACVLVWNHFDREHEYGLAGLATVGLIWLALVMFAGPVSELLQGGW